MITGEKRFAAGEFAKEKTFWLEKLSGDWEKSYFPYDFTLDTGGTDTTGQKTVHFEITGPLFSKLTAAAKASDYRLFMILAAGIVNLLAKYTGRKDLIVGMPIDKQEVEGEFINTVLALRIECQGELSFKDLLMNVRQTMIEAGEHQNFPIEMIANELNIPPSEANDFPLFDTIVLLENIHDIDYIRNIHVNTVFSFFRVEDKIKGEVETNGRKYARETIDRIIKHYLFLLEQSLFNPGNRLSEVSLLSKDEKEYLLEKFNKTGVEFPEDKTIHELFQEQVSMTPGHEAVRDGERRVTYKELNEKANSLAFSLKERGIKEEKIIALMGHRSIEMITAILGVLKAGAAYLPINAQDPDDRIKYLLTDSRAQLLLTEQQVKDFKAEILQDFPGDFLLLINSQGAYGPGKSENPASGCSAKNCAYIIYTSGTTGKPKGVLIEHKSLVNYINWAAKTYVRGEKIDFPFYTSFSFDMSITSIFTPLVTGNAIVVYGGDEKAFLLGEVVKDNQVEIIKATPSHLKILLDEMRIQTDGPGTAAKGKIKRLVVGGEKLETALANDIFNMFHRDIEIYNEYGPTEATVGCMIYRFDPQKDQENSVPIGVPIANSRIYLLDPYQKPVPPGIDGELYIGGDTLARGYLYKTGLTAETFTEDPFIPGGKMYKTGDVARWLPDGNIEYIGRIDNQVKIRGFRIELGEIEACLQEHPKIKEAVVIHKSDYKDDVILAAYYTSDHEVNAAETREFLSGKLPDYMVPLHYIKLDTIPLTSSGKVDRQVLPEPRQALDKVEYIAPRNDFDKRLVDMWAQLFGIEADKIGITMNFFELGGHSLNATVLIANLHKAFDVRIPLADVFRKPTIKDLSDYIAEAKENLFYSIEPAETRECYLSSSAQQRLYVLQQLDGGTAYNIPAVVVLEGHLEKRKVEAVFTALIARHESFRTSFETRDDIVVQKINHNVTFNIEYDEAGEHETQQVLKAFVKPFDLGAAPLLRVGLIKTAGDRHIMMVDMHHSISDGGAVQILFQEFMDLYGGKELPGLNLQYKDYAQWQNSQGVRELMAKQETYWLKQFETEPQALQLPLDYRRPAVQTFAGGSVHFEIQPPEAERLRDTALLENVTVFMTLFTVFTVMLSKLSGQEDIVIGTPVAGRIHADLQPIIGMFVNTLAVRAFPRGDKRFDGFLAEVKQRVLEASENQDYHFEDLVAKVVIDRDLSRNPLFDVMFTMDDIEINQVVLPGLKLKRYEFEQRVSKFDISLLGREKEDGYYFTFEYCTRLFKKETIQRFVYYFKRVLAGVLKNRSRRLSEIEIISAEERKQVLFDFNRTEAEYPGEKTIHQLFEEQVQRTPDGIAIQMTHRTYLTYDQLNKKSDQLAHRLQAKGIKANAVAAISMERSLEMIIGIFGILKAGGAYLPIDPGYPAERIHFMLEDSGAVILLKKESGDTVVTDLSIGPIGPIGPIKPITQLCYVIYTSGTTGRPKGVMIEHHSLVNRLHWMQKRYALDSGDTLLQKTPFTFDVSVWEIFWWSMVGARLCLLEPGAEKDPGELIQTIARNRVTVLHFVPSMLSAFLEYLEARGEIHKISSLRQVIASGEALEAKHVKRFNQLIYRHHSTRLANLYGPTEAAIDVSYYDCQPGEEIETIPIGKPIDNIQLYVVDSDFHLLPIGVAGELCIAGVGLARGYLKRPQLTGERFVSNPFGFGEFMYRTGDLARWLPDGNIEFIGRMDHQVKIRGYRIELGEIENQLLLHESVKDAVVLAKEDEKGNKYLCGYIASDDQVTGSQLKEFLAGKLPDHMIPAYFVTLENIPLTPNGKVDRKALLNLEVEDSLEAGTLEYRTPANPLEEKLLETWKEVLGRKQLSTNENFFTIGGDSIRAIQIISRLNKAGYNLEMKHLFRHPSIVQVAPYIKPMERIADQSVITGPVPLTPIQYWFYENHDQYKHHFNQAVMLHAEDFIEAEIIETIFKKLQEHHDALRITVKQEQGHILHLNHGLDYPFFLEEYDYRDRPYEEAVEILAARANEIQSEIDLEKGPLMKLALFHLVDGDRLLIVIHHLAIDGISWRILFEDMETLYRQYKEEQPLVLPQKTDSYKLWARQLREYADSQPFLKEKEYWINLESQDIPAISKDYPVEASTIKNTQSLSFELNREETTQLLTGIHEIYHTEMNDILLTGLGMAVKQVFGKNRVWVAFEGHGREGIIEGINMSRTVGWFTSIYPLLLDVSHDQDLGYQVIAVKESLRRIPGRGIGYGILRYLTADEHKKDVEFRLNPGVRFNYLGQFDTEGEDRWFRRAKESPGMTGHRDMKRLFELDIVGMIADKQLNISITYSKEQYKAETLQTFLHHYKGALQEILRHFSAQKERILTPADLTCKQLSIEKAAELSRTYPLEDIYPLTSMQEGMLFHTLYERHGATYFMQISYQLQGRLDLALVQAGLKELFKRYDILRAIYIHKGLDRPLQVILKEREVDFFHEDISRLTLEGQDEFINNYKLKDKERAFDPGSDVLLRLAVIGKSDTSFTFTWSWHHILIDGWCIGILNAEFLEIYRRLEENRPLDLPGVKPYRTYIQWLQQQDREKSGDYWRHYLDRYEDLAGVPLKNAPEVPGMDEYKKEQVSFELPEEIVNSLKRLAGRNQVTMYSLLQAVWGIMLSKYNGRGDVVFGSVVSGRPSRLEGVERMVGLFINTVPVRIQYKETTTFAGLLKKVQEDALNSEPHHYYPLARIQAECAAKQNLFDHILIFENYPIPEQVHMLSGSADQISQVEIFEQTNYDLNIIVIPPGPSSLTLTVRFEYNANVYDRSFMEKMKAHFLTICSQIIGDEETAPAVLTLISEEEKREIIYDFNDTEAVFPADKTIHQLFEEQVERTPDGTAIHTTYRTYMTYDQLNKKSNQLAHRLQAKGVTSNDIVGILMQRSIEMIIGIFGILKAGGAYLPIDPGYPVERIQFMLKDSSAGVLLSELSEDNIGPIGPIGPIIKGLPTAPCYVIYTSGSTGKPKGVLVEHASLVNRLTWMQRRYPIGPGSTLLQKTPFTFDVSVWELFWWALEGAKLCILAPGGEKDPAQLVDAIERNNVSVIHFVPSMLNVFLDYMEGAGKTRDITALKQVIASGEALSLLQVTRFNQLISHRSQAKLANLYGPTEATIDVSYFDCPGEEHHLDRVPIGQPIDNIHLYIVNSQWRLQPVGVTGELCIAGKGLARGYLNKPTLTSERFVLNPAVPGEGMYRTGDLARWLTDGNIEFLGRQDRQVKVRGFRIEPAEIESKLLTHDKIKEAVVLAKDLYLYAYIVSDEDFTGVEIREYLSGELPDYMIPSYVTRITKIPLTPNGKIDRKALEAAASQVRTGSRFVKPQNDMETRIAEVWQEVLHTDRISVYDNFFDVGGTSIDMIHLSWKLQEIFKANNLLMEIFRYPTIRSFARCMEQGPKMSQEDTAAAAPRAIPGYRAEIKRKRKSQKVKRNVSNAAN